MEKSYYRVEMLIFSSLLDLIFGYKEEMIMRSLGYIIVEGEEFEGYLGNDLIYGYYDQIDSTIQVNIDDGEYDLPFSSKLEEFILPEEYIVYSNTDIAEVGLLCFKEKIIEEDIQDEINKNLKDIQNFF